MQAYPVLLTDMDGDEALVFIGPGAYIRALRVDDGETVLSDADENNEFSVQESPKEIYQKLTKRLLKGQGANGNTQVTNGNGNLQFTSGLGSDINPATDLGFGEGEF